MSKIYHFSLISLVFTALFFQNSLHGQFSRDLGCQSASDAFIGLDRKDWTSNIDIVSESYQLNFDIPEPQLFSCSVLDQIQVSITGFSATNNIPPECYLWLWTHALNCSDNAPISCPEIIFDQMGLQTIFSINGNDVTEGTTIGIDIVVVIDATNLSCIQETITNGLYSADFEICLEAFYVPDEVEEDLDLGDDIEICEGVPISITGPDNWEIYEWEGPIDSDEQTIINVIPGQYTLEVTDSNGCRSSDDIEIIETMIDDIEFNIPNNLIICGDSLLDISVINYMDNSDFDIEWELPDGSIEDGNSITTDSSGLYMVTVLDQNNFCQSVDSIKVSFLESISARIIGDTLSCGSDSLQLAVEITPDDSLDYTYQWIFETDTSFTSQYSVLGSGNVILNLSDSMSCLSSTDTLFIMEINPESAGEDQNETLCQGEIFDLSSLLDVSTPTNGIWIDVQNSNPLPNSIIEFNVPLGILEYEYIVVNTLPCSNDTSLITINIVDADISAGDNRTEVLCFEAEINLMDLINGDGGGDFFDTNSQHVANTFIESSALNVGSNLFFYIVESPRCGLDTAFIDLNLLSQNQQFYNGPICEEESILINNTLYDLNNSVGTEVLMSSAGCDSIIDIDLEFFNPSISMITRDLCENEIININNPISSVVLSGQSENGCDSTVILDLTFISFVDTLIAIQLCDDETITIENVLFDINHSDDQIILTNGSKLGCDSIINVNIEFTSAITADINNILCIEDYLLINGTLYNINNAIGTEMLSSVNGCDSIITVDLSFFDLAESVFVTDLCDNDFLQIGSDIYNEQNLSGTTILTGADQNGCDSLVHVDLSHNSSDLVNMSELICDNDSIFIVDEWASQAGIYSDTLINLAGCDSIITTELSLMVCTIDLQTNITNLTCFQSNDGVVEIFISDSNLFPVNYKVTDQSDICIDQGIIDNETSINFDNMAAGIYTIEISNISGVIKSETFEILDAIEITIDPIVNNVLCGGESDGSIELNAQGGNGTLIYEWSNGMSSEDISNLTAGQYEISVSDQNDCEIISSFTIDEPQSISYSISSMNVSCPEDVDGTIEISQISGGTEPLQYSIDGLNYSDDPLFSNLLAGDYTISVMDVNNCEETSVTTISINSAIDLNLPSIIQIEQGDSIVIIPEINFTPISIMWSPDNNIDCASCLTPTVSPLVTSIFSVVLIDEFGCSISGDVTVEVLISETPDFYLPNIFTPFQNTGSNNTFMPLYAGNTNVNIVSFRIYDRWGNEVFSESSNLKGWTGFINGEQAQQGVYVYSVEYQDALSITKFAVGDLLLIR